MDDELERFKTDVNLVEFAASVGYTIEGSRTSSYLRMRHSTDDHKIVIHRKPDGHWTYFSNQDGRGGTVIDLLKERRRWGLGQVRKELRAWLRIERPPSAPQLYRPSPEAIARRSAAVRENYSAAAGGVPSAYLIGRGLRRETLSDKRFRNAFRVDERGNVLFPHDDGARGIVGYELKNKGLTRFATGGQRTLWRSAVRPDDDRLVIVEAPIDALSYHQLFPHERARYVGTAGAVGQVQIELVRREVTSMPLGSTIVIATDNDAAGERFAGQISQVAAGALVRRHVPPSGKDWNEFLQWLDRSRPLRRERRLER